MGKTASAVYENAKPDPSRDRLIGDGDGPFLRVRPHGTKTWVIEYEFQGRRTKYTIGGYSKDGAPGESIPEWLWNGQQSLTQARSIAGNWKAARRVGHEGKPIIPCHVTHPVFDLGTHVDGLGAEEFFRHPALVCPFPQVMNTAAAVVVVLEAVAPTVERRFRRVAVWVKSEFVTKTVGLAGCRHKVG